jgi:hypothetical protein
MSGGAKAVAMRGMLGLRLAEEAMPRMRAMILYATCLNDVNDG